MLSLISLLSLVLSANGLTRFVIDNYTIPDPDASFAPSSTLTPFPIDVCLNYQVQLDLATFGLIVYYGKFTCNEAGTEVTFTDFGPGDSECTEAIASDSSNDHTITDTNTFNCVGEDNYVEVGAYTVQGDKTGIADGGRICCGDADQDYADPKEKYLGIVVTTFATETCIPVPGTGTDPTLNPLLYARPECDAESSGTYTYTDALCTVSTGAAAEGAADAEMCELFEGSQLASIYRLQLNCVYNGTSELPATNICPDPTSAPTMEPTANPTAKPTEAEEEEPDKGFTYYINHIALLIIAAAIFVN